MKKFIPSINEVVKGLVITAVALFVLPKLPVVGNYFNGSK